VTDVSAILGAIERGDPGAPARLWDLVYDELRRLAAAQMAREAPGQTLDTTALVHEAYVRMAGDPTQAFANRRHFYAAAAGAMRRILIEAARSKARTKRGGGRRREHLDLDAHDPGADDEELLALHDALEAFAAKDPLKANLVELRYFGGLSEAEAAECLDISVSTASRAWRYARAWLHTAMSDADQS
jgi:RNA polymerase sigma factor (TIGR02999 family)